MNKHFTKKTRIVSCLVLAAALLLSACHAAGDGAAAKAPGKGGSITVMLPPWAEPSPELLKEFTDSSGIRVTLNIIGWDDIRDKIAIAAVGHAAPADVVEVDWSWVGEFAAAGWLEPLDVAADVKEAMPTLSSFTYQDQILAVPYSNDFRIGFYNTEHFEKAGITEAPTTWDQVVEDAKKIKEMGICQYPIAMVLSATEPTTNTMLWLTRAKYGAFFNDDMSVNHDDLLNTLNFVNSLVNVDKLIDPASLNMKDTEVDGKLLAGSSSFMVAAAAYAERIDDPELSQITGKGKAILVPGSDAAKSATFALPEGLGIPKYAKNKAAAKLFIDWYTSPDTQIKLYSEKGNIPTSNTALDKMTGDGTLKDGETIIAQTAYIQSPFPGGIPSWYSEMSNSVYNNVNQMAQGAITPLQACTNIEKKVDELRGN